MPCNSTHTGQSSSGGVNIVAVIIAVVVIILILCISVPICAICLVIALACTCVKYRKAKQLPQAVDSKTENSSPPNESRTSVHHLPLPPIPTDVGESMTQEYEVPNNSEIKIEANQAYGSNMTTEVNQAYDSNLTTEANKAYESDIATEENQAYELGVKIDETTAYELDIESDLKIKVNRAYGSKLSADAKSEAAASTQTTAVPTDGNVAYGHSQIAEESDEYVYEYI